MLPLSKLKSQAPVWDSNQRYRATNVVIYNAGYWENTTGINSVPVQGVNWIFIGYVTPSAGGSGAITKLWKAITVTSDADFISDADFEDALSIDLIASSSSGNVTQGYIFDAPSGTISNYPVFAGEVHVVYYTKP